MNRLSTVCLMLLALASSQAYAGFDHRLSELPKRRGHPAGELRDAFHRELRPARPVDLGPRGSTGV